MSYSKCGHLATMAERLPAIATERPHDIALVRASASPAGQRNSYDELTYFDLNEESDRVAGALARIGVTPGTRAAVMVPPGPEFLVLCFGLFKLGAVLVLTDPSMGTRNLARCFENSRPEVFIGISKAHAARVLLRWSQRPKGTMITVGRRWFWGGYSYDALISNKLRLTRPTASVRGSELAAIIFTSGSTGVPKGACYTHDQLLAQVSTLKSLFQIEPGEIDLCMLPLFALYAPLLGTTAVIPQVDSSCAAATDLLKLVQAIKEYRCTSTFLSSTLLDRLGRFCVSQSIRLPSLRRIVSGGATVSPDAIQRFYEVLDSQVEIVATYGATEALPVASVDGCMILEDTRNMTDQGAGVCVGWPADGLEICVIPISDDPITVWSEEMKLRPNQIGEIVVSGPLVTSSYYSRPRATQLAKISDPKNSAVRHRMGDVGYLDNDGRLWLCGRKSQLVNTERGVLYPEMVEGVFNAHPQVYRSALVGIPVQSVRQRPIICVQLEAGGATSTAAKRRRITAELLLMAQRHDHTREIDTVLFHRSFPVDRRHNSKIQREELARWASRKLTWRF